VWGYKSLKRCVRIAARTIDFETMTMITTVPTIDLRRFDTEREQFVDEMGNAYRTFGFCCFSNHGIPEALIRLAYEDFRDFFALPDEIKRQYYAPGTGGARGYTPFKVETAKDRNIADLKEFWHVGREETSGSTVLTPNVWPREVPVFRQHALGLFQAMESVGERLLSAMAMHIGLSADFFASAVDHGNSILRALHYPPVQAKDLPAVRAGAHEDIDLITLLVGATDAGLELLTREGNWIPVEAMENTLIVNVGDMMQRLTNHTFPSTTHRVINPVDMTVLRPRYSMPFFMHPNPEFIIETLPQCISSERPNLYPEPINSDDYLMQRLREIKLA
jgi:isopenicillin N synthase-like dioxygenase